MSEFEWISVILTILAVIIVPTLALVLRLTIRWTRTEGTLTGLAEDMRTLVQDKDKVHAEMYRTMREDRAATDRRLRWLEEHLWKPAPGGRRP